jgi:uroporphyrinogen decarboxylase
MNVIPIIAPDHASKITDRPLHEVLRDGRALADVLLEAHETYGHDLVVVWCDMYLEAEAVGVELEFPIGEAPHPRDAGRADRLDWRFDPDRGRIPVLLEAVQRVRESVPEGERIAASLKGPFSLAGLATGMETFLECLLTDPGKARDAIDRAASHQADFACALAEAGAVPWFGDPLASGDLLGGTWFREFALGALKTVVRKAREIAGVAAVHICGDPTSLVEDLPDIGADWLSLELDDPRTVKTHLSKTLLLGGMPTERLLRDDPETIHRFARDRAENLPPGCVLATDCDVPELAPRENIQAMIDGAREGFLRRDRDKTE